MTPLPENSPDQDFYRFGFRRTIGINCTDCIHIPLSLFHIAVNEARIGNQVAVENLPITQHFITNEIRSFGIAPRKKHLIIAKDTLLNYRSLYDKGFRPPFLIFNE